MFLNILSLLLRVGCSLDEYKKFGLDINELEQNYQEDSHTIDENLRKRGFIINILKDKEVLIVLDNTEDPLEQDNSKFVSELNAILDNCRKVKFLATTRKTINKLAFNTEYPYILKPLKKQESLQLLISKSPRSIKTQELQELLACEISKECVIAPKLNIKRKSNKPKQ